jgi:hypothetical protein
MACSNAGHLLNQEIKMMKIRTIILAFCTTLSPAVFFLWIALVPIGAASAFERNYCAKNSGAAAVDLSDRVNQQFLTAMKNVHVETIIRYYDHPDETLVGKTLKRSERDLITLNGFKIAIVFQHNNNRLDSFTSIRGRQDAERSRVLAGENAQPVGSAVYFGVDGPWSKDGELANITAYFKEVNGGLKGSGYRVGVYGSGFVCRELLKNALAELCWLSNAKSWPEYDAYYRTGGWRLVQVLSTDCGGRNVDFNLTNGMDWDYGQFAE